jgi:hypothetical protein
MQEQLKTQIAKVGFSYVIAVLAAALPFAFCT